MPRPATKDTLLELSQQNFQKLNDYIDGFSEQEQLADFPAGTMNRNIRDVLAHLHHWHLMMLDWYQQGMAGNKPEIPAPGYTWKTVPALNKSIWEKYREDPLPLIRQSFNESFTRVFQLIQKHSQEELFEKKRYPWTGSTSLGAYLISATSSHYDWAFKLIKKARKQMV